MSEDERKIELDVRRFLLGEMAESERASFEERFIADESLFEQVQIGEDELIESYVRGSLTTSEKNRFERNYLTTDRRRDKVKFTRAMLARLSGESLPDELVAPMAKQASFWHSIVELFSQPAPAFGAVFAILLAVVGGWYLLKNVDRVEIAEQRPQPPFSAVTPLPIETVPARQDPAINSNSDRPTNTGNIANTRTENAEASNKNSNTQKQNSAPLTTVLALFAGTLRSEGKTAELNLPKNAGPVILQLNLEARDYKIYQAEILNAEGETISKSSRLTPKGRKLSLPVPASLLLGGDYIVKLSGLAPQDRFDSVADYTFRVTRK